jgi:hypothetical protein
VRALPFILTGAFIVVVVYYMGKLFGLWSGLPKLRRSPKHAAPAKPAEVERRGGNHDDLPAADAHTADIMLEAGIRQHGVWLYVARQHRVVRVRRVVKDDHVVWEVEALPYADYSKAGTSGGATIQLFTFPTKRGAKPWVRSVHSKIGGPPDFELQFAGDVSEGSASELPTEEVLAKLKQALQLAGDPA